VKVKTREEVLKDPLKQDYFEIVDRLDASAALPSLNEWQAERRAGGHPLTLQ
jgi:branched-chain amino acid transport system substrate-binding protein